jgi:hypothetical protein
MRCALAFSIAAICLCSAQAQQTASTEPEQELRQRVQALEAEVNELKQIVKQLQAANPGSQPAVANESTTVPRQAERAVATSGASAFSANPVPGAASSASRVPDSAGAEVAPPQQTANVAPGLANPGFANPGPTDPGLTNEESKTLDFLRETTINVAIDTYYEYNFNNPIGGVNLLRSYDVLSNQFSLNQADLILDHPPDANSGRRWGGRLDLQFGQATDTLQGNPANEPRPQIYRSIFQAYGSYILPIDKGVEVDFGKWSSSLGIEGNYTKDQMNYSRSFWFNFLPFYHMGLRASIPVGNRFSVNYWVVNGTNQVEATNGFKDELWGFTATPTKSLTWTFNYYLGQEHPDRAPTTNCGPVPAQPGLCFTAISPAPNGHTNILDTYATWQATKTLTFAIEGDYYIQQLWQHSAPGEPASPAHVDGGAAYLQYRLTPKIALATRAEYMSDRGGLFSGITQALKENTATFSYQLTDSFLMRYEWRRDYSNQPTFLSDVQGVFRKDQTTLGVGLVWWWGGKQGAW